ncbi:hypothetical protein CDS [Bradyrhizobium sp.]|nr:hypothetical protein CDS [Bradyrhizobium sp.]
MHACPPRTIRLCFSGSNLAERTVSVMCEDAGDFLTLRLPGRVASAAS